MKRREVSSTARSSAPPSVLLELLNEGESWAEWGPWTESSLDGPIRRLRRAPITMVEEVFPKPDGQEYRVLSGLPLRDYHAVVTVSPVDDGSQITWASTFFPKWPGTGWFFGKWLSSVVAEVASRAASAAESRS
jgi:Polyketide cyclase / dehydrase and lipid transport